MSIKLVEFDRLAKSGARVKLVDCITLPRCSNLAKWQFYTHPVKHYQKQATLPLNSNRLTIAKNNKRISQHNRLNHNDNMFEFLTI